MSDHPFGGEFMNFMNSPNFENSPPPSNSNSQSPQIPPIHNQFPSAPLIPQNTQLMNSFNYQPFSYPFFPNSSHPFILSYYGGYGQNTMPRPFMVPSPSQQMEGNSEDASITGNEAPHNVTQQEKNSRLQKREFPYTHVWEMVKDEPKWEAQVGAHNASKKTKTSESRAYTSSSNHDIEENTYEGNESESRPISQKAAKRKMRGKEKKDVTESVAEEFAQKLVVLNEIKNKAKEDTLRADYEILMKDTSTMSDQQLIIHNHTCSIIKARHDIP
uniref:No apical meristem-associated C-terminal domain-containing protein n=1 Tax=Kalanchoe fedtschenkoi TaxID=63787 RepID=A0A7N1A677_KALFE